MKLATVVLAAGEGTRMKSRLSKILHPLVGKPVAQYAVDIALEVGAGETVFVIGKDGDAIRQALGEARVQYVYQPERKGTGHATMQARNPSLRLLPGELFPQQGRRVIPLKESLLEEIDHA